MSEKPTFYQESSSYTQENSNELTRPVRQHLLNVYLTLAAMCVVATGGVYMNQPQGTFTTIFGFLTLYISSIYLPFTGMNSPARWITAFMFALSVGLCISGLLYYTIRIDPSGSTIIQSLVLTALIFASFSVSAIFSRRQSMLYLGGILGSILNILLWVSFFNVSLFRSQTLYSAELYISLFSFMGFILYQTQLILELARLGLMDVPGHAVSLFTNIYSIFIRLLEILSSDVKNNRDKKEKRRTNRLERNH